MHCVHLAILCTHKRKVNKEMERKTLQLKPEHHNWFASYKKKRGFKNTDSAFDEIRKLADEHFFDIVEEPTEETYFGLLERHKKEFNEFYMKQVDKGNAEVLAQGESND